VTSAHPNREQLTAFLCGRLSAAEQDGIAAHVAACDQCCQALREIPDDAFVALLKDASSPPETGDGKHYASLSRDLSLPMELRTHPRYKIGKFLGSGGMGVVYQAEHRLMDRLVALKILHQDLMRHPRVVQRFRKEVKTAARLSHPNIVTAYDADQAGDAHFLVMEFVDGMSLDRLIAKRGPLEPGYACYFIRQAAKGLAHAFEAGMVHRDIKPQNLMLTRKGQVKILDFGLARLASETRADLAAESDGPTAREADLTSHGDIMGTPDFMAPEQALDASQADIRADIYSLGCVLYYLLAGQKPFASGVARANLLARKYAAPTPINQVRGDLPAGLVAIIEKMMAKDAGARYQTPAAVVKALAPYAKPVPVAAPLPAPAKKPTPPPAAAPPVVEAAPNDAQNFLARCPFCVTRIRIPTRALGASLPCPQCGSFFTAVPEDEGNGQRGG
jgi:eukaryotic-like serine/threonine-protein kinase